jgi:cytochrome c-type biogenesis protein CcmF
MIGSVIIWITFAATLASTYFYYISTAKKKLLLVARGNFFISLIGVFAASALLMVYILQHRFEYNYIANYSSRDLPIQLLITTFWAGQEGSFLLWAFFAAVIGFVLQRTVLHERIESEAMAAYSLVLSFLLLLIAIK